MDVIGKGLEGIIECLERWVIDDVIEFQWGGFWIGVFGILMCVICDWRFANRVDFWPQISYWNPHSIVSSQTQSYVSQ